MFYHWTTPAVWVLGSTDFKFFSSHLFIDTQFVGCAYHAHRPVSSLSRGHAKGETESCSVLSVFAEAFSVDLRSTGSHGMQPLRKLPTPRSQPLVTLYSSNFKAGRMDEYEKAED